MGAIPEITLASNPDVVVRLREATVSDAMDFADVDGDREEVATSLFLDRLQDKAAWTDPKQWTGEDRRLVLFWYWMHTARDTDIPLTYQCGFCGEQHTALVPALSVAEKYVPMKGKPERDVACDGRKITIRPLDGAALEDVETIRLLRDEAIAQHGEKSGKARSMDARLRMMNFMRSLHIEGETVETIEKWLLALPTSKFEALSLEFEQAMADMRHWLPSALVDGKVELIATAKCPNSTAKGEADDTTSIRFPFWAFDYIPGV